MAAPASPTITATAGPSNGVVTLVVGAVTGGVSYRITRLGSGDEFATELPLVTDVSVPIYDDSVPAGVVYTYTAYASNVGLEESTGTASNEVRAWPDNVDLAPTNAQRLARRR